MKKYDELTGVQKKYAKELRAYFIGSLVTILLGLIVFILSFTFFKGNSDVLATAIQLLAVGILIGGWAAIVRCNDKVLKDKATRYYDERLNDLRLRTIDLAHNIFMITLLLAVIVFIYIDPVVSVLLMCVLMFVGVAYGISYLIVNRSSKVDEE